MAPVRFEKVPRLQGRHADDMLAVILETSRTSVIFRCEAFRSIKSRYEAFWKDPALHVQSTLPASASESAAQSRHTLARLLSVYFPVGHSRHSALPLTSLYLPAEHAVHWSSPMPVYPGLHSQAVLALLHPAVRLMATEHDGQTMHSALPGVSLYVPTGHAVQLPPFVPV